MSEDPKQNTYWKSLKELSRNEEYEKFLHREFPEDASEMTDQVSRRSFLRVMGASIALAGFASCRRPVQKIMPYSRMPEDKVLGQPSFYATSMPFQDSLTGLLVENNEGRPTKLEGNDEHPSSGGRTSIYNQAAVLSMYDPDRSRSIRNNGNRVERDDFIAFAAEHFSDRSRNIAFISEANSSPTYNRLKEQALEQFSNARWVTYEPFGEDPSLEGTRLAFGRKLRTLHHFDLANVVISLDDDFMSPQAGKNSVEDAGRLTSRRAVRDPGDSMSRLYCIESNFSITGSYADHRLRLKTSEIETFTYALASRLSQTVEGLDTFSNIENGFSNHEWIERLSAELLNNRGEGILTVGNEHKPAVHAAVAAINQALQNAGNTVTYHEVPYFDEADQREAFQNVVNQMHNGQIDTVVLIGVNPVFNAPSDLDAGGALDNAGTVIHLSDYVDESSVLADWHVNRAHFLEAWGDGFSFSGVRSVIQPQVQPLFGGWSEVEFLQVITTGEWTDGYELVRETWSDSFPNRFENSWRRILHDGLDAANDTFPQANVSLTNDFSARMSPHLSAEPISGIEITIKPDAKLFDGRYANNGWLMELPDPMTKITWDNVALMSPATAEKLGIPVERHLRDKGAEVVRIDTGEEAIEIAAWIQPGHADDSITLTTGYGRSGIGRVADGVGVDTYPLRQTDSPYFCQAEVSTTGRSYEIACVQDHHNMEGRDMIREASMNEYRENPDFASYENVHGYEIPGLEEAHEKNEEHPITLFNPRDYPEHEPQWGMAIDLNACFGCGVCTLACQAENNIPVVGKREVGRRRIMHWIRTDRYFEGGTEDPKAMHQPVPCMHCELAPCEQVCPVAATTHSEDGMNQMTYNRCIGTRYCSNNCPYKVRRFNFFNYSKEYLTTGDDPEIIQMAMNPEVTVRFRGVMEKCTYCVQRVNRAKINAKKETGSPKPADGAVKTACQQACPANAISFGDLTDPDSSVSRAKQNERNYVMLEEINVRPRTSYLAKLRNPNPDMV
ncbi:MAG: TAT-variant-translocated molybdopterin oxidoreductase [Balneolaceae bacterium]